MLLGGLFVTSQVVQAGGLTDFKNNARTIEDYTGKGKWLLVMIWASDCHICNKEATQYVDFHFAHSEDDATVLGISTDGQGKIKEAKNFIKRHSVDFPNLIGEFRDVAALYRSHADSPMTGTPGFLLFNPKGVLKAATVGAVPTSSIEKFIEKESKK